MDVMAGDDEVRRTGESWIPADERCGSDAEPITPMTDEEASLFRFIRYGILPGRVDPEQTIGEVDTRHLQPPDGDAQRRRDFDGQA
jgi:hypothetical protein